ncbi:MAG: acetolactate decarboxylase [Candidatus Kapabacteria bacterium]|nr:acetolactate decarboxylase [Candidatus Kapabacteria bacterium]
MRKIIYTISSFLLITACGTNQSTIQEDKSGSNSVKIIGAMRNVMHKGELFGTISLDTISNTSHLYGLGPLEYLKGEILVIDGKAYVSRVITDTSMKVEENWEVKAPFFVYANVEKWKEVSFPDSIQTIPQLEIFLENISENKQHPFVFKVSATVQNGDIHIVNLPEGTEVHSPEEAHQEQRNYPINNEPVEMIGFFSTEHQGVFTHHDSYVHIHLITNDKKKMGHLDDVVFKKGTVQLFLPE